MKVGKINKRSLVLLQQQTEIYDIICHKKQSSFEKVIKFHTIANNLRNILGMNRMPIKLN